MAAMADDDDLEAFTAVSLRLEMNFGNQRTSRINHAELSLFRFLNYRCRDSVGTEDGYCIAGRFTKGLDEKGSILFQILDDMTIVDDLMQHIDRCVINL
jgi:hypothetical protein